MNESDDDHPPRSGPESQPLEPETVTVFEALGGAGYFHALVDDFYARVEVDELLRPSYPEDLTDSKRWLALFLVQYWGGPGTYSEQRGHPRLRMRHAPFVVGMAERNAWLRHMTAAVAASEAPDEAKNLFGQYFDQASLAMINQAM